MSTLRYLAIGTRKLFTYSTETGRGYAVTDATVRLTWDQPQVTFTARGPRPALMGGLPYPSDCPEMNLSVLVKGTSVEDAQALLGDLRQTLYYTRTTDGGLGTFTMSLYESADSYVITHYIPVACLASSVDVESYDQGRTFLVTFKVRSSVPAWQSNSVTVTDLPASGTYYNVYTGPVHSADYQATFMVEEAYQTIRMYDTGSGQRITVSLTNVMNPVWTSGEAYYVRFDSKTQEIGWVSSLTDWSSTLNSGSQSGYDDLLPYLTNPYPGVALTPTTTGDARVMITGATQGKLRYRTSLAIEA